MEFMGVAGVAAIGVIAYLIGEAVKISPADNKYIPGRCSASRRCTPCRSSRRGISSTR